MTQKKLVYAYYLPTGASPPEVLTCYLRIYKSASWVGYRKWCATHNRAVVTHETFVRTLNQQNRRVR